MFDHIWPQLDKRGREVFDLLIRYKGRISLTEIAQANPGLLHTFRNPLKKLKDLGMQYKYHHKTREYVVEKWPGNYEQQELPI